GPAGRRKHPLELLDGLAGKRRSVRDDLLFLISDFQALGLDDVSASARQWSHTLRRLPCDVVPVLISFELPREQRGTIKLWDPERRRQRLTLVTPSRIDRINALERQRIERIEKLFRSVGLSYLTLRRERDVYPSLAWLARARRGRGA
ncbi:MAG TPA: hypothetical protein VHG33_06560, partial [Woeseiaceae bacterium]|nr:hypothetical protein [Woeseiaceae bacterium]